MLATLYQALLAARVGARRYHGGLTARERRTAQDDFMEGRPQVIVATNAFGLGIDKADRENLERMAVAAVAMSDVATAGVI